MAIKRKKINVAEEEQIITGMVVCSTFLSQIKTFYQPNLMQVPYAREIAEWCLEYYEEYEKSPEAHIQEIFETKTKSPQFDEDNEELIGLFLNNVSEQYSKADKFNSGYALDQALNYFKKRSLEELCSSLKGSLSNGTLQEAEKILTEHKLIQKQTKKDVNPFEDQKAIEMAFTEEEEILFTPPGALGKLTGPIIRDGFLGIMGPEKRGKTWWLMQFGLWAGKAHCKVAFFQCGDMTEPQIIRRMIINITGKHHKSKYCGEQVVPVLDCWKNQTDSCTKQERPCDFGVAEKDDKGWKKVPFEDGLEEGYIPCSKCKNDPQEFRGAYWWEKKEIELLSVSAAQKQAARFQKRMGKGEFRLICHPAHSISVRDIDTQISIWKDLDGFVPDVVLIDYADILAPIDSRDQYRHQQNNTWTAMRGMAQKWNCAVITATQADAASYNQKDINESNFSEDKRKYGHVNLGIMTLNQIPDEKRSGVMRIGMMFVRDDGYDSKKQVTVLQSLKQGRPYIDSF